jgi:hypothetical protein
MRALTDIFSSTLGSQMALVALILYEAWPRFIDGIFDFSPEAQNDAKFWSLVVVIGIGVSLVWRWHRRQLALQIGVTTTVLFLVFSYLQAWISADRWVGIDEWSSVVDDQWLWFWVVLSPFAAGAWWVRQITGGRRS